MNFIVLLGPCMPQPKEAMVIFFDGASCPSTLAGMMVGKPKAAAAPVDFFRKERRVFMTVEWIGMVEPRERHVRRPAQIEESPPACDKNASKFFPGKRQGLINRCNQHPDSPSMNPGFSRAEGNRFRSHGCSSLLLVLFLALHWGLPSHAAAPPGERMLLFIGSNTLGEHAVPGLARAYLLQKKQAKDVAIQRNGEIIYITGTLPDGKAVYIEVHATGSGDCFKSFLGTYTGTYDQCDIGMSSRRIKGEEVDEIEAKTGDVLGRRGDAPGLGCEHPVAMDGLAIITHQDNPLNRISFTALKAIYSNQLKDWKK